MSKYDEQIAISHEEEGTYHRRQVEPTYSAGKPVTTYHTERYLVEDDTGGRSSSSRSKPRGGSKSNSLMKSGNYTSDEDDKDNYEEWTTSKRKVNHKTRQVETRVSRQLLMENGKVIADSGPQVTTRIKEDNKVEECEKEKTPKNKSKFEALEAAPEGPEGSVHGRVLGEKKEIQRVSREVREENMQYHDERFRELTGHGVHQKAIRAPHELITINDKHHAPESAPRGKMVHYSNRGKKYQDTDEICEVAKLAIDGSVTKEVKRTHNHEEFSEDELPDEKGEAEKLRHEPVVQRSSRRHVDYVNDYDDMRTPEASDNDEREEYDSRGGAAAAAAGAAGSSGAVRRHKHKPLASGRTSTGRSHGQHNHDSSDEAFPRYDLDPLLNSLKDEDYKPSAGSRGGHAHQSYQPGGRVKEVSLRRRGESVSSVSSSEAEYQQQQQRGRGSRLSAHAQRPASGGSGRVEIPEVYRKNKERLLAGKSSSRERSYSPQHRQQQRVAHTSSSSRRRDGRNESVRPREDAATQAHLTDEEIERQSIRSSLSGAGAGQHAKTAQHLQRQSTPNASRRYYYGNAAVANEKQRRPANNKTTTTTTTTDVKRRGSITSSASSMSSIEDAKARARQQGVRSRDSGFRSPHSERPRESPDLKQQQIYSVSSKGARGQRTTGGATSPTPSAGQRSVKTTTTTVSAGLAERPESRASRTGASRITSADKVTHKYDDDDDDKRKFGHANGHQHTQTDEDDDPGQSDEFEPTTTSRANTARSQRRKDQSLDTISVSSLKGPNATKIKVPYRHVIEIQQETVPRGSGRPSRPRISRVAAGDSASSAGVVVEKSGSEMSFQDDIESLSKRLANISQPTTSDNQERRHFDYKTFVANVQSVPRAQQQQQHTYNVTTLEQNSPFQQQQQQLDNNNETNYNLGDYYVKYRATPALVDESSLLTGSKQQSQLAKNTVDDEDDRMSQVSSKTYKIRTIASKPTGAVGGQQDEQPAEETVEFDENGNNSKRPAAWIFDPRDGSSTAIVPPARPKQPEPPKVDSKTEELVQAPGGRSYYLELVEPGEQAAKRQRPSSMDSLYSRWNSQGALNTSNQQTPYRPLAAIQPTRASSQVQYKSTKQINSTIAQQQQDRMKANNSENLPRRQLPFSGPPSSLGDKSKSSSCLLSVTKPSKYSIYGGFRKPGETNKPVPRLSYSRAIGPRSQRIDGQPKPMPSRYLKMR